MNSQNTSFIPQHPTQGKINSRSVRKIYILSYISYVLFFGTVIAAIGVILYTLSLHAQVSAQKQKLTEEKSQFGQGEIESILQLESLIKSAKSKMDAHISIPRIFTAVEISALESLKLTDFSYKRDGDEAPVMTILGSASNFNDVLFQREVLKTNPVLAGASFSKITLAAPAVVTINTAALSLEEVMPVIAFEIGVNINPALVNYVPPVLPVASSTVSGTSSVMASSSVIIGDTQ